MTRKPRQARSKASVDAIIEACFQCVARDGLHGTSTRRIAEVAGVSVGTLYEYFPNKEAIFEALAERFVSETLAMVQPLIPRLVQLPIDEAVYTLLMEFEALLRKNDEQYLKCVSGAINTLFQDHLEKFNRILMELVMQYAMHNTDVLRLRGFPAMTYIFINGGIFAVVRHLSDPNPPVTFEELARGLANMVGHYVAHETHLLARAT